MLCIIFNIFNEKRNPLIGMEENIHLIKYKLF